MTTKTFIYDTKPIWNGSINVMRGKEYVTFLCGESVKFMFGRRKLNDSGLKLKVSNAPFKGGVKFESVKGKVLWLVRGRTFEMSVFQHDEIVSLFGSLEGEFYLSLTNS